MSFETLYPGAANLIGNVAIARNVNPTIRASIRRNNPDGVSSAPYYPTASGKTLRLTYTIEVSTVVTPATVDIALSGTSMATVIANINAADTANIQAFDLDGFLTIKNLNPGKTHVLTVSPFSTPSSDAAPVLGFAVSPFPGSTSFAGEISPAPGARTQLNPQTTTLLSKDDALGAEELNRGFVSVLQMLESLRAELARDVIVYKNITLSFVAHATDGITSAKVNDDTLRFFYPFPEIDPPTGLNARELSAFYRVLDPSTLGEDLVNFGVGTTDATALLVTNLYYATTSTPFISSAAFSAWGTPDGGTIVSSTTANKTKHPSTSITSIKGNIVTCSAATFVTHKVKAGDPVQFTALILQPFDHSGWFAVDAVIDETHLAIRPMAAAEETALSNGIKPRFLNPLAGGTLRVSVGRFVPAGDIFVAITASTAASHVIRAPVGIPYIQTLTEDRARDLSGSLSRLSAAVQAHLGATTNAHTATAITGFTSATSWRDTTTITGVNLKQTIEDILTDLKAQATGDSGTGRVGAEAISIGGGSPNTLAQGTILTQLTTLLTAVRDHVNLASGAHAASSISYAGGASWADGTTNPAATVEAQLDKIVTDLGGTGGASKIKYDGGPAWADTTTNPATTVEGQLDKVITDLSASTGSAKIGGAASGTDISAGTAAAQIANLAVNWLKMARANVIAAAQTFTSLITANGGVTAGANQHITVSGTGKYKRGSLIDYIPAGVGTKLFGNPTQVGQGLWHMSATGDQVLYSIIVRGDEHVSLVRGKVSVGTGDFVTMLVTFNDPDAQTQSGGGSVVSTTHTQSVTENLDFNPNFTPNPTGDRHLTVKFTATTLVTVIDLFGLEITKDIP